MTELEVKKMLVKQGFKNQYLYGFLKIKNNKEKLKKIIDAFLEYGLRFLTLEEVSKHFTKKGKFEFILDKGIFIEKIPGKNEGIGIKEYLKHFGVSKLEEHGFFNLIFDFLGNNYFNENERLILKDSIKQKLVIILFKKKVLTNKK